MQERGDSSLELPVQCRKCYARSPAKEVEPKNMIRASFQQKQMLGETQSKRPCFLGLVNTGGASGILGMLGVTISDRQFFFSLDEPMKQVE
jgi:hypothetical protein